MAELLAVRRNAILLGLAAGAVSGMFGVGGGVVIVPGLVLLAGFGPHRAHATSVGAIVFAAAAGASPFAVSGDIEWVAVPILFVGSAAGAYLGAKLIGRVPAVWLIRAFVVVLLVSAVRMAI